MVAGQVACPLAPAGAWQQQSAQGLLRTLESGVLAGPQAENSLGLAGAW